MPLRVKHITNIKSLHLKTNNEPSQRGYSLSQPHDKEFSNVPGIALYFQNGGADLCDA